MNTLIIWSLRKQDSNVMLERKQEIPAIMISSPQNPQYLVGGDANGAWSRLESLRVFTPASRASTLDLVDVTASTPQQTQQKTFTNTTDLEDYIDGTIIRGGTRYM